MHIARNIGSYDMSYINSRTYNKIMKTRSKHSLFIILTALTIFSAETFACSTFKLQNGNNLIYGHNLNEGDIGVPGMIFINKRSIFKTGRTWSEIITIDNENPSSLCWISRYGSVTFNNYGRDFPDGGMNEAGLYIWEMNTETVYPKNDTLPKLNQMNWMQYVLDNCATMEEAIVCANEIEIDGWGWHYFIGDINGKTAAVEFIDGKTIVHKNEDMPIPALFNSTYEREIELLNYFIPYGGAYSVDISDPQIPRFVKADYLLNNYDPSENIVDYGFYILDGIKVNDEPEWSIVCDVTNMEILFKTRLNPEIKSIPMSEIDFSNNEPVLIMNMDTENKGNALDLFIPYSHEDIRAFTKEYIFPILPVEFFTNGGLSMDEYLKKVSLHTDRASFDSIQYFKGSWKNEAKETTLTFYAEGNRVTGTVSNSKDTYKIEHLSMIGNDIRFTFRTNGGMILEIQATIKGKVMVMNTYGIENFYGREIMYRE